MISVNLSIEQLIEAVTKLNPAEKEQVSEVLGASDFPLSDEQKELILQRHKEYKAGTETYSIDEVKSMLNYTEYFS